MPKHILSSIPLLAFLKITDVASYTVSTRRLMSLLEGVTNLRETLSSAPDNLMLSEAGIFLDQLCNEQGGIGIRKRERGYVRACSVSPKSMWDQSL